MITYDMGAVAEIADRVIIMREGRTVESALVKQLFATPGTDNIRELLACPLLPCADTQTNLQADNNRESVLTRALPLQPKLFVADECVSALDVSVQVWVLDLLRELCEEDGVTKPSFDG